METGVIFNLNSYGSKAEEDIFNAKVMIEAKMGTPRASIFWCEQAIEKYFKHVIATKHDRNAQVLIGQHRLVMLANDAGFSCSSDEYLWLRELTSMYYERYPTVSGEPLPADPNWNDATSILALAVKVRNWTINIAKKRENKLKNNLRDMNLFGDAN